ncbi:hypothetical protein D1BOALGB6SA_124, partial [Olavius sp. associated proteobacterium Delta 1]
MTTCALPAMALSMVPCAKSFVGRRLWFTLYRMKHTYPRAIQMVQNGIVDVRSLVTHRFPLSE